MYIGCKAVILVGIPTTINPAEPSTLIIHSNNQGCPALQQPQPYQNLSARGLFSSHYW